MLLDDLPQDAVLRRIEARRPMLAPEAFAGKRDDRDAVLLFFLLGNTFDILADDAGGARRRDEDRFRMIAFHGIIDGLPELVRSAEDHVAFLEVRIGDAEVLRREAAHHEAVAVQRIVLDLPGAASDRRVLNQHGIADMPRLALYHLLAADRALRERAG